MEENNENKTDFEDLFKEESNSENLNPSQTNTTTNPAPKKKKKTGIIIAIVVAIIFVIAILALVAFGVISLITRFVLTNGTIDKDSNTASYNSIVSQAENNLDENVPETTISTHPVVEMTLEEGKVVKMELYPEYAPNTVANFLDLVSQGFYDGLTFHRLVEDFVLQGGDPTGTGSGSSDYCIKGEFSNNGYSQNTLKHTTGVLSMARSDYSSFGGMLGLSSEFTQDLAEEGYNSAYSQFFIMLEPTTALDGNYAAFGKVIEGMNYIEDLSNPDDYTMEDENGTIKADQQPKIVKMTIDDAGRNYLQQYGKVKRHSSFDYSGFMNSLYSSTINGSNNSTNSTSSGSTEEDLSKFFEHTEQ